MQLDKCILFQVHIYFESEIFIWMNEDYHLYIHKKLLPRLFIDIFSYLLLFFFFFLFPMYT